uniref:Uncharacterized protein n=1 Tax=Rhizophora mucronata TaxID=61149 RepID=A0A2P2Q8L9_RHIMU
MQSKWYVIVYLINATQQLGCLIDKQTFLWIFQFALPINSLKTILVVKTFYCLVSSCLLRVHPVCC